MSNFSKESSSFYFLIFQKQDYQWVRCWFDGSEDYTLKTEDEIISLLRREGLSEDIIFNTRSCLITYDLYLLDVEQKSIISLESIEDSNSSNNLWLQEVRKSFDKINQSSYEIRRRENLRNRAFKDTLFVNY